MKQNQLAPDITAAHVYRSDIDGLRAIAVLSVVVYHAFPSLLHSGFIGVDIFFVISGYLISTIIIKGTYSNTFSFIDFYSRRIKRIIPALIVVLIACLIFGWFGLLADDFRQLGLHVFAGIGFVSNLLLWSESGYFDGASDSKVLLHLWSLGIEEQFYIIWPILIGIFCRRHINLLGVILLFLLASFTYNLVLINLDPVATFYSPLTRVWELLIGALLAYVTFKGWWKGTESETAGVGSTLVSWTGVVLLAAGFLSISDDKLFPGAWALLPVLGAALLIASGPNAWFNRNILSNRILVWFGLISYPLYLWHWPLLSLYKVSLSETPPVLFRAVLLLFSILLAWCTYRFIEKPIRTGSHSRIVTPTLIVLMLIVALLGFTVAANMGLQNRAAVTNSDFTPQVADQFMGDLWQYTSNEECLTSYPFEAAEQYRWWFCMKSGPDDPSIAILGNSYANQLYPGFVRNTSLSRQTVLSIGICDIAKDAEQGNDLSDPCQGDKFEEQQRFLDNLVLTNSSIQYIFIAGLSAQPDAAYIRRLTDRVDLFEKSGRRIVIFNPHLRPARNPTSCFSAPLRRTPGDCTIPVEHRNAINTSFQPLIDSLNSTHPNVLFFDQNIVFCDESGCSGVRDGMPMHRDMKHTSEYAAIKLQPDFTEWASSHIPEILNE